MVRVNVFIRRGFAIIGLCVSFYFFIDYTDIINLTGKDHLNLQSGYNEEEVAQRLGDLEQQIRLHHGKGVNNEDGEKKLEKKIRQEKWNFLEHMLQKEERAKHLPSIIGIGTEKCGTHALAQFLWPHPLIKSRTPIEAHFFENAKGKNIRDYIETMPKEATSALIMEKTPAYFSFPPRDIPKLIKNYVPNAKLLLVLCDPSKRVISDYHQELIMGSINKIQYPTVEDYLQEYMPKLSKFGSYSTDDEGEVKRLADELLFLHRYSYKDTILTTGLYALHLTRWLPHFNKSSLFIVNGDEMMKFPGRVIERIQDFLHIPKLLLQEDFAQDPKTGFYCFKHPITDKLSCMDKGKMRTRNGRTNYSEETMRQLKSFYKLPNEHLYRLLNQRFGW